MITDEFFEQIQNEVRDSKPDTSLKEIVCCLSGSAVVIEFVVKKASINSGIKMDWSYTGGRAYVFTSDIYNIEKAKTAIEDAIPTLYKLYS